MYTKFNNTSAGCRNARCEWKVELLCWTSNETHQFHRFVLDFEASISHSPSRRHHSPRRRLDRGILCHGALHLLHCKLQRRCSITLRKFSFELSTRRFSASRRALAIPKAVYSLDSIVRWSRRRRISFSCCPNRLLNSFGCARFVSSNIESRVYVFSKSWKPVPA